MCPRGRPGAVSRVPCAPGRAPVLHAASGEAGVSSLETVGARLLRPDPPARGLAGLGPAYLLRTVAARFPGSCLLVLLWVNQCFSSFDCGLGGDGGK